METGGAWRLTVDNNAGRYQHNLKAVYNRRPGAIRGSPTMEAERILNELTHYERLPVEAMRAAAADREVILPHFIQAFAEYTEGKNRSDETADFLLLAFHLLGEWREKTAYWPLARFLRLPTEDVERTLGDATTETSHRVMAAVFDGDPQPLYDVIRDSGADEFIRARMCDVLAMVTPRNEMPREETARFLRACFTDLQPQQNCFVWVGWQSAIALLGLEEFKPLVKAAFDRGSIGPHDMGFEDFEEDLSWALGHPDAPHRDFAREYTLWNDSIRELSAWYGFSDKYFADEERWASRPIEQHWTREPAVNVNRNVGRNDPCPCGSGKKFKKCCLN
jgi:hypothetical protein